MITIAVSGCSSSGKTTLTTLLHEVFSPLARSTIVVQQDSFFVDKIFCPIVNFQSMSRDNTFLMKTMNVGNIGSLYVVEEDRCRTPRPSRPLPIDDHVSESWSELEETTYAVRGNYDITGPDVDCSSAVDFSSILRVLMDIKTADYEVRHQNDDESDGNGDDMVAADTEMLKREFQPLIEEMQERVIAWANSRSNRNTKGRLGEKVTSLPARNGKDRDDGETSILSSLCFVDGFLLFTDPAKPIIPVLTDGRKKELYNLFNRVKSSRAEDRVELIDRHKTLIYQASELCKQRLMPLLDIKLFLTSSKHAAHRRRQSRYEYLDFPDGLRQFGQAWKTYGYFDAVVWKNYTTEHCWLVDDSGNIQANLIKRDDKKTDEGDPSKEESLNRRCVGPGNIHVREEVDAGIDSSLRWAVDTILAELGTIEDAEKPAMADARALYGLANDELRESFRRASW